MTRAGNLKIVRIWALHSLFEHLNSFVEEIVLSGITLKNPERVKRAIIIFFFEKKKTKRTLFKDEAVAARGHFEIIFLLNCEASEVVGGVTSRP